MDNFSIDPAVIPVILVLICLIGFPIALSFRKR